LLSGFRYPLSAMKLGYFYSRYPVISQTFCDAEMLALEALGFELEIGSVYPPLTSLRHEHIARLRAPIHYAPPQEILKIFEKEAKASGKWPRGLVEQHERNYGPTAKAGQRARNALYFADFFARKGVEHVHVHFANRAAHTALFLKQISGISFSVTAHGQDFMKDLGSEDLLREICAAAEFVAAETDYSRNLLRERCPDSAGKIHRVYNGIDLERFPAAQNGAAAPRHREQGVVTPYQMPRIISVGRLVAFKGFEHLIDACGELARRGFDFVCEIIGDGPLREKLQAKIENLDLSSRVHLLGSLSQQAVLEKLQAAEIFALASTTDAQGATDVFPTVILEAMAAARPVVSTHLAGIPELVSDGETGILAPPSDTPALTDALEHLLRDSDLRSHYGRGGRTRIEQHFRIEQTVAPLVELFHKTSSKPVKSGQRHASHPRSVAAATFAVAGSEAATPIAYLIDRWPENDLPLLEHELEQMKRCNVAIVPIVCEMNTTVRLNRAAQQMAPSLEFLPDAMVLEAEWRTNTALAQKLEEDRAQQSVRAPGAIFLRQARFALALQKLLRAKNVSHVHATSSCALVCALILKKLANVTISATIEPQSELSREWIKNALSECVGGRLSNRKLLEQLGDSFVLDKATFRSAPRKALALVGKKTGIDLTTGARFWQQWAELLLRWSCSDQKSKACPERAKRVEWIGNRK
jgi:glycosyltransferase involved in cell wall biosynthesis